MRKTLRRLYFGSGLCALVFFLGIMTGCTSPLRRTPPPAPPAFEAKAIIHSGEWELCADFSQESPGIVRAVFTAPGELEGLTLSLEGNSLRIHYGEQELQWSDASPLPATGFLPMLRRSLLQTADADCVFEPQKGGGWRGEQTIQGLRAIATLDENGSHTKLEVPALDLVVELRRAR